jgi:hypothetical protein
MTREEILELAHQAGNGLGRVPSQSHLFYPDELELFAALIEQRVAAAEREACAQIVDANAAACANNSMLQDVLRGNAAAIRARGEKP